MRKPGAHAPAERLRSIRSIWASGGGSRRIRSSSAAIAPLPPATRISTPSASFRTSPDRPSSRAIRQTVGRNPTPCTRPRTLISVTSIPSDISTRSPYLNGRNGKREMKACRPQGLTRNDRQADALDPRRSFGPQADGGAKRRSGQTIASRYVAGIDCPPNLAALRSWRGSVTHGLGEAPSCRHPFSQTAEQGAKALHPAVELYCAGVSIDPGSPSSPISGWCGNPDSPPPCSAWRRGLRVAISSALRTAVTPRSGLPHSANAGTAWRGSRALARRRS